MVVGGVVAGFAVASATSSGLVGNNKTQLLMVRTVCLYCMYVIDSIKMAKVLWQLSSFHRSRPFPCPACPVHCTIGWVNVYQKFEIEKYSVGGKLILPKKWKGI